MACEAVFGPALTTPGTDTQANRLPGSPVRRPGQHAFGAFLDVQAVPGYAAKA